MFLYKVGSFAKLNILPGFDIYRYQIGIFMYPWVKNIFPNVFSHTFQFRYETHSHLTRARNALSSPSNLADFLLFFFLLWLVLDVMPIL